MSADDIDAVTTLGLIPGETTEIVVPDSQVGTGTTHIYDLTYYVNDINTSDGNVNVLSTYGSKNKLKDDFSYGAGGRISASTTKSNARYYLPDGRGSVSDITSASGAVQTHYSYGPFGEVTQGAGEEATDLAYNAEEYNPITGLQYLRARYYDPTMGHFGVEDSLPGDINDPATLNLYSYVAGNPINRIDPSGHSWLSNAWNSVKKVGSSIVSGVKKAASWVNNNIIQPVIRAATPVVQAIGRAISNSPVGRKVSQAWNSAKATVKYYVNKAGQVYTDAKTYVKQKAAEITASVEKFVCTTTNKIKNTWDNIDWARVAGGAIKIGLAVVSIIGAATAIVAAIPTGGASLAVVPVIFAGVSTLGAAFAASDAIEGIGDIGYGATGSDTKAFNPIRDKVFQGNNEAYNVTEDVVAVATLGTGVGNAFSSGASAALTADDLVKTASDVNEPAVKIFKQVGESALDLGGGALADHLTPKDR